MGDLSLMLATYRDLDCQPTGKIINANPGQVWGWYICNNSASARFVKLYNKATAPASTDTPAQTFQIPGSSAANVMCAKGIRFTAGIGIRGTTGVADNDTGAPTTNDLVVNIFYA